MKPSDSPPAPPGVVPLTDREFALFSGLAARETGIVLGPRQRSLLQARLGRRLRALGLENFREYHQFLMHRDPDQAELARFVGAITTHKTSFFREAHHFTYLGSPWAGARSAAANHGAERRLRLWSAGCSSGEEAYTLAMVLAEAGLVAPRWDTQILASDIDPGVLAHATEGRYTEHQAAHIPLDLRRRYWQEEGGTVRARPELRVLIHARRLNLAEPWEAAEGFDVILCRNVLIYFDQQARDRILGRLVQALRPGGLLMLGHAESAIGRVENVRPLGPTIYVKTVGEPRR
jgi:chemotaxis protein methyltransferase CheR